MIKSPGAISSLSEPTALNAIMALTPTEASAAMFARAGTADGLIECATPWRARKATLTPLGKDAMVIGELGNPHGCQKNPVVGYQGSTVIDHFSK